MFSPNLPKAQEPDQCACGSTAMRGVENQSTSGRKIRYPELHTMRNNQPVTQREFDFPDDATLMSTTDANSYK